MSLKVCKVNIYVFQADTLCAAVDIGQSGANVGSSAASAFKGTSIAVQGTNAGSGIATGGRPTEPEA